MSAAFTPLRFSHMGRELFGLHLHPRVRARSHAVLLCNPFGQESIRAHRLYRALGDRLAAAGYDVLRFDYYASGDSAGDDTEWDLDGAVADTLAAACEVVHRSGAPELSLIGLRLGGNIAALASAGMGCIPAHLILLEPLTNGAQYTQDLELANARAMAGMFASRWRIDPALRAFNLPDGSTEVLGFALSAAARAQIGHQVDAGQAWPGKARRTFVVARDVAAFNAWVAHRDCAATPDIRVVPSDSDIDWATNSALNTAIVPRTLIDHALSALADPAHA